MPKYKDQIVASQSQDIVFQAIDPDSGKPAGKIGEIRITPTTIKWKPRGTHAYFSVSRDKFVEWITDSDTGANKTKS